MTIEILLLVAMEEGIHRCFLFCMLWLKLRQEKLLPYILHLQFLCLMSEFIYDRYTKLDSQILEV